MQTNLKIKLLDQIKTIALKNINVREKKEISIGSI